ncbi:uncharacterized protein LOC116543034 [Sapajus apella]|uniref:Uncharacterized protein LOC116543034 n=1 Tax=Sapajus apella TaxID=9515 RepID=A0A6J3H2H7_SAPAP|nr:uncharacterized protein LOC116543034 [Sapajus apella]
MAAAEPRPHLCSPRRAARHMPQAAASAPWTPSSRIPGLPQNPGGCTFMPIAQAIPLQVDMAMALQRVRIAEEYGKNYLCLLQAVFVAGKSLSRISSPAASGSNLARLPFSSPTASPGEHTSFQSTLPTRAHTLSYCSGAPNCELAGSSVPFSSGQLPLCRRAALVRLGTPGGPWETAGSELCDVSSVYTVEGSCMLTGPHSYGITMHHNT